MRSSSVVISFLSSLSMTSVSMAMEEPNDSVLHDVTSSILEESLVVKYNRNKTKIKTSTTYNKLMSHLEPLKIRNDIDGRPNKDCGTITDLVDSRGDISRRWNRFII